MSSVLVYIFAIALLVGVVLFCYFTRNTNTISKKVMKYIAIGVVGVFLLISLKNRIPFISSIIDWIKNKFADDEIEGITEKINDLKEENVTSTEAVTKTEQEAKDLSESADLTQKEVSVIDKTITQKEDGLSSMKDPITVGKESVPEKKTDAAEESESLLSELKSRNS